MLSTFTTGDGSRTVDCAQEAGGCIVGVNLFTTAGGQQEAWAPIAFTGDLTAEPQRGLADGDTVAAAAGDLEDGTWSIAQCTADYVSDGDPSQAASACGPATDVTAAGDTVAADLVVRDPLVAADGTSHPCGYTGCVLVLARPAAAPARTALLSFGPPTIALVPDGPVARDMPVDTHVAGMPGDRVYVATRRVGVTDGLDLCGSYGTVFLNAVGAGVLRADPPRPEVSLADGTIFDCNEEPCVVAAFAEEGGGAWPWRP